jgi:prepilin-type N-terminal cleavage/methylation domain-containing protein
MNRKGFTLIELLIVIAIIGTLAVVILLALNPVQQLARTRDSGRQSAVTQLGHAVEAFATTHDGLYPAPGGTGVNACPGAVGTGWITDCLVAAGEISSTPATIAYNVGGTSECTATQFESNICYRPSATFDDAIVYAAAEAQSNLTRCTGANEVAYFVYSASAGRGGIVCAANEAGIPTPVEGGDFLDAQ